MVHTPKLDTRPQSENASVQKRSILGHPRCQLRLMHCSDGTHGLNDSRWMLLGPWGSRGFGGNGGWKATGGGWILAAITDKVRGTIGTPASSRNGNSLLWPSDLGAASEWSPMIIPNHFNRNVGTQPPFGSTTIHGAIRSTIPRLGTSAPAEPHTKSPK